MFLSASSKSFSWFDVLGSHSGNLGCDALQLGIYCVPNYRADLKFSVGLPSAVETFVPNCTTSHP